MPRGDRGAEEHLTELFREYHDRIRAYARRRVGLDAAHEIVSATFLAAWRHIDELPDHPLPWLYRTASFEVANHRRRLRADARLDKALLEERLTQAHGEAGYLVGDERTAVAAAFAQLSPADRELLRLAAWEQVSSAKGAAIVGCSITAYRVRLHRARRRLERATERALTTRLPEVVAEPPHVRRGEASGNSQR